MANPRNLSPSSLDVLSEGRHADAVVRGLCVVVSRTGRKTWQFRRRISKSEAILEMRLGTFPAVSLADARQRALELNDAIDRGLEAAGAPRMREPVTMILERSGPVPPDLLIWAPMNKVSSRTTSSRPLSASSRRTASSAVKAPLSGGDIFPATSPAAMMMSRLDMRPTARRALPKSCDASEYRSGASACAEAVGASTHSPNAEVPMKSAAIVEV